MWDRTLAVAESPEASSNQRCSKSPTCSCSRMARGPWPWVEWEGWKCRPRSSSSEEEREGGGKIDTSLPLSPVADEKTRRRWYFVEFLEQHWVENRWRKSNLACCRKKKQQWMSWEKKKRENGGGRVGRRRVARATAREGASVKIKMARLSFPGAAARTAKLLVCDCGWFGWTPGRSRADDLIEISEILGDVLFILTRRG